MSIESNLNAIRMRIREAELAAGREPGSVRLLAVSKTFPVEDVREAYEAGQMLFGENKVQEGQAKIPLLPSELEWHLIGPLQRNKVRKALPLFGWIHSLDSLKLVKYLDAVAGELGVCPKVFFEVNIGEEESKHGFMAEELKSAWGEIVECSHIEPVGLMCIPPIVDECEDSRPYFAKLRELRDQLAKVGPYELPELSMGMSHDFEVAIAEGSTIVRVGTAIFGGRDYSIHA